MQTQTEISQEFNKYINFVTEQNFEHETGRDLLHFTEPVHRIFHWMEEDYSGECCSVYKLKVDGTDWYTIVRGSFGSCSGCDPYMAAIANPKGLDQVNAWNDILNRELKSLVYYNNLNDTKNELSEYSHPDLVKQYNQFVIDYIRLAAQECIINLGKTSNREEFEISETLHNGTGAIEVINYLATLR